jgi:ATPase
MAKTKKSTKKDLVLVPDTSVIIEGILSKRIESKEIKPKTILIHEAVMSELESQANKNRETGYQGLEEVKKLKELCKSKKISLKFSGNRPTDFEIKYAKSGEIDSLIRSLAEKEKATLVTADKVQAMVGESKGIDVILYEFEEPEEKPFVLEKFFDSKTMSVHIKEGLPVKAKKGKPGDWDFKAITKESFDGEKVKAIGKEIIQEAFARDDGFVESDKGGSSIIQISNYRIVITRPPFSDANEITAVRPIKKLKIKDYSLNDKMITRIDTAAEGILIAGAPGNGKTTFAQALAEHYLKKNKIVKTLESPRDLNLGDEITQFSTNHGSHHEIHDILLLSRPDYTLFDEVRNNSDFKLFSDLRLSGVGMVGVVHATNPIDSVQRFLSRIELGVVPHVVDTVVFIKAGMVEKVYTLEIKVKVPSGMKEADLARPVVAVYDFDSGKLEYEIYTYGEQTVVMPVDVSDSYSPTRALAEESIKNKISKHTPVLDIELISESRVKVFVPVGKKGALIGRDGQRIEGIERELGVSIDVVEQEEKKETVRDQRDFSLTYSTSINKKSILVDVGKNYSETELDLYLDGDFLLSATASKKGVIKISKNNKIGKILSKGLAKGEKFEVKG